MNTHIVRKNYKKTVGFTLIELMVTITLIAILSLALINIDFRAIGWVQKEDRLSQAIIALIRDERIRTISGKGILTSNNTADLTYPSETRITISQDTIKSEYLSGGIVIWTGSVLTRPFFGEDGYLLESFSGTFLNGTSLGTTSTGDTINIGYYPNKDLTIQYVGINPCPEATCTLIQTEFITGYNNRKSSIIMDSRSGLVQKK